MEKAAQQVEVEDARGGVEGAATRAGRGVRTGVERCAARAPPPRTRLPGGDYSLKGRALLLAKTESMVL